ncbi:aminotransferase class I/II-fold pyridoxal phosphate-dependent enzyme [Phascolarctobacterium sp.]|uniref:methionine gamma-lyase family protein n=1 Tax=Phascolarctobacterium sp. TaxID=2049039 RepID=UPI002A81DC8C|nr:methionine gamma-lyase family protein [Phascolarctobacterium sp.]MDY5045734.1 methionine gamma-lyase family protein [Phascolarctobacterium sp.]
MTEVDYQAIEAYALAEVAKHAPELEAAALVNTEKVITAFRNNMVSDYYLKPTTGYGYSDVGRDTLDLIYAEIFKTEAALVRSQFVSGTHALAVALLGNLRPGDELIGLTGTPYDTMQSIIGYPVKTKGSLVDLGITYKELPMSGEHVDLEAVKKIVTKNTKMVHIQRSCGYSSLRKTISVAEIGRIIAAAKEVNPDVIAYVDNCYGEFIEKQEPTEVGADIMAGSLIKNLGGGLAPTGGYIVGRADLVENASYRLTAPGLGGEMGATLGDTQREFYQGLFLAPHVVQQAVKTAIFAAAVFQKLGYEVKPLPQEARHDIIQAIKLESKKRLCDFCIAIQSNSPVDAHVEPVPAPLPGYQDDIVMAAGTFVQGASIELSADGPCREPYNVFFQGGLTFEHGRLAIMAAAKRVGPKE